MRTRGYGGAKRGAIIGYATAAVTVNNSATMTDITGCSVNLKANTVYRVKVSLFAVAGSTGVRVNARLNFSSAPVSTRGVTRWQDTTNGADPDFTETFANRVSSTGQTPTIINSTNTQDIQTGGMEDISGEYIVTTNAACTLKLQACQRTAVADDLIFQLGSFIEAVEV